MIRDFFLVLGADVVVVSAASCYDFSYSFLLGFSGVVISPGPGSPESSLPSLRLIKKCAGFIPMLGVCLGMQCIAISYGATVVRLHSPAHALISSIKCCDSVLFRGLPDEFNICRYHSLCVSRGSLAGTGLSVTSVSDDGVIMSFEHDGKMLYGVQFHPESLASDFGVILLSNFLSVLRA